MSQEVKILVKINQEDLVACVHLEKSFVCISHLNTFFGEFTAFFHLLKVYFVDSGSIQAEQYIKSPLQCNASEERERF